MKISIINYEAGNAVSVYNSLKKIGWESELVDHRSNILASDLIILPGVGSAKATLASLDKLGLIDALNESVIENGIPFLGICIGYQIIFEFSEEDNQECLGWVKGMVRKFDSDKTLVPQIGWNQTKLSRSHPDSNDFKVGEDPYFYFVNSYYANPSEVDRGCVLLETDYGERFSSMILKDNMVATQFHVEKSGPVGLALLNKIVSWGRKFQS